MANLNISHVEESNSVQERFVVDRGARNGIALAKGVVRTHMALLKALNGSELNASKDKLDGGSFKMIKRISLLVFACLLVASFSFAADTAAKAASTKSESAKSMKMDMAKVSGTVDKIDSKTHTLTINTGTESKNVTVGSHTVYMEGGKKVKGTTLKEGAKVDVWADSKNMAHKIEIESAAASH